MNAAAIGFAEYRSVVIGRRLYDLGQGQAGGDADRSDHVVRLWPQRVRPISSGIAVAGNIAALLMSVSLDQSNAASF